MHRDIGTKIAELRELRTHFDDSRYANQVQAYPKVHGKPPKRGHLPPAPASKRAATLLAMRSLPRHFRQVPAEAKAHPQAALPHADQQWWRLAQYDSVLVSSADGGGAAWLRRDPRRFRAIVRRSAVLHARLAREWDALAAEYKQAVPDISSPDAWAKTFAQSEAESTPSQWATEHRSADPTVGDDA
jgi:galactofuranosylgalactofuranosylrhamnosyl-N-acetylglucosaminyl-diphospho-decaprenol beta-1,5/1,6-galactofuranosyltransferase